MALLKSISKTKIIYKGDADVHGWVETGAWVQNTGTTSGYFSKYVNPDNAFSVGIPGTAKKMVTIGAYVIWPVLLASTVM